jgi:LacI family transcriptional regulator
MPPSPTIHTVAAAANVSIATVSKVVNGIRTGVSEPTRKRVEAVIEQLGYRPSRIGRSLRTLRRSTIGMAIVDPNPTFLADPFITNLVAGLANYLSMQNFGLFLQGVKPHQLQASFLVRESEVDAMCVMLTGPPRTRQSYMHALVDLGQPIVAFQELLDVRLKDVCFVRQDDRGGAMEIARRVVARGARSVTMFIADIPWPAIDERIAGVRAVLSEARIELRLIRCDETKLDAVARAVTDYLDKEGAPDALIGQNDQIALTAMRVLKTRGLRIPDDVAVYGFNAFPFTEFADPALTTVRSPAYELGEKGAELLLARLESGQFASIEHVLPVSLVPGASG